MITAGVGFSFLADPLKAALEASDMAMGAGGLVRADFAIFFCTSPHGAQLQEISAQITKVTAAKDVAGCTGFGVMAGTREVERSTALCVLVVSSDSITARSFFIKPLPKNETHAAEKIVAGFRPPKGSQHIGILFPDFTQTHPELLLHALQKLVPQDTWVGGCPSSSESKESTYQVANAQAGSHAVSGLYLAGDFHPLIGIAQGAIPIGKTYTITKSKENMILQLDGKMAYDSLIELAKTTKLPTPKDPHAWIFMAIRPDIGQGGITQEGYFVRNILGVDPERGLIAVAARVQDGQQVSFALRDAALAKEELSNVLKRIKRDLPGPIKFGLYFNCSARGTSLYQTSGVDAAIIEKELGEFPLAGFFTNGEIGPALGPSLLHNFSGVLFLACD